MKSLMAVAFLCLWAHFYSPVWHHVKILEHVQGVAFRNFDDAVHDSYWLCPRRPMYGTEMLSGRWYNSLPGTRKVVGDLTSSVKTVVTQCFLVILSIVYYFLQPASFGRHCTFQPFPEILLGKNLLFHTLLFPSQGDLSWHVR